MRLLAALILGVCLFVFAPTTHAQESRQEYVRVTFYTIRGPMASGIVTHKGAAACSYGFPMGTVLEMPDWWQVTCLDRGLLGRGTGWVDIWAPSYAWGQQYIARDYGDYAWVTVIRWGWDYFVRLSCCSNI